METQTNPLVPVQESKVFAQFKHEGTEYGIVIPKFRLGTTVMTAEEAAADEKICAQLVALASEGPEGPREEEDFHENGILVILY